MIIKFILLILIVALIYFLFFKKLRQKVDEHGKNIDELVECPKCGTFVSKRDGILSNGRYYCCKECLK